MRDFLRLLLIAILSFVVVGFTVAYSRDQNMWQHIAALLRASGPRSAVEETKAGARLWMPLRTADRWTGLAGFPDSSEVRFALPAGLNFLSGGLELAFEAQLGNDGDGRMTLAVNGERRGEIVLDSGNSRHEVEIPLDATDLLGGEVLLTLEGRGTTSGGQVCPVDATNSGAAIAILPESGLALYTDDPTDTLAVRIATLDEPLLIAVGDTPQEQAFALWVHQQLVRKGVSARFAVADAEADVVAKPDGQPALSLDEAGRVVLSGAQGVDSLLRHRVQVSAVDGAAAGWPMMVDRLGVETLVKNFRGSRRWSVPFRLADLDGGLVPGRLDFSLKTSLLAPGNEWVVRVSLNGNLLATGRFDGQSDIIDMSVRLPAGQQALDNAVLIELIDTSPNDSICRVGPDAQAQLLPSSTLVLEGGQPQQGWPDLVRHLAQAQKVGLSVDALLSPGQITVASALLGQFLPLEADIATGAAADAAPAKLQVLTAANLRGWQPFVRAVLAGSQDMALVLPGAAGEPALLPVGDAATSMAVSRLADDALVIVATR